MAYVMSGARVAMLIACAAAAASGQFRGMATDFAGDRLFFTTELQQRGTDQPAYGKLFLADANGLRPLLIRSRDIVQRGSTGLFPNGQITSFYNLTGVDVSAYGTALSVTAVRECAGYTSGLCRYADQSTVYNERGETILTADGRLQVSPDGKWALQLLYPLTSPGVTAAVINLATKESVRLPVSGYVLTPQEMNRAHSIANDGSAVIGGLLCSPDGKCESISDTQINTIPGPYSLISADGSIVAWEESDGSVYTARRGALQNRTLVSRVAVPPPALLDLSQPAGPTLQISDDGSCIVFVSAANHQLYRVQSDGSRLTQITSIAEGIATAVLSGSGAVLWAQTRTGRLLKIAADSGSVTEVAGPAAGFVRPAYHSNSQIAPSVEGTPGQVLSVPASVMPGESVSVTVDGTAAPVVLVKEREVEFQLPWTLEAPDVPRAFPHELRINKTESAAWVGNTYVLALSAFRPKLLAAVHQDFGAVVTDANPARAGEIVHVYATGFGAVSPSVSEGLTPPSPLFRTTRPVTCRIIRETGLPNVTQTDPVDTLFAGLAPGFTGIFQLDIRLPETAQIGGVLACESPGGFPGASLLLPVVRPDTRRISVDQKRSENSAW